MLYWQLIQFNESDTSRDCAPSVCYLFLKMYSLVSYLVSVHSNMAICLFFASQQQQQQQLQYSN